MKKIYFMFVLLFLVVLTGCQLDLQGPSVTAKVLYKGENQGYECLSRGSGMSGGNGYSAAGSGMITVGNSGPIWSFGNAGNQTGQEKQ